MEIVRFEHVHVARGRDVVLHDISLRLDQGEHLVILGPNGCGKSTLMKTMTCEIYPLVRPETRVSIMGRERWDLTELKRRMGVVQAELPGKPILHTTGLDAVITGFFSSSTLWPNLNVNEEMRDRAEVFLLQVGGRGLRDKLVGQMSAGQQRRIMIARAIAGNRGTGEQCNDPKMLLLDEPSNALDLAAQQELRETMSELARSGTAIVLITHHIADILPEMQRVLMMRDGRVHADGRKRDLLTETTLGELFGCPIHLSERDGFFNAW